MSVSRRLLVLCLIVLPLFAAERPTPPPVNPLLTNHSKWFDPPHIYDLQTDPRLMKYRPAGLNYRVFSAVGFDLANTIAIIGPEPKKEIVIIDTLGDTDSVDRVIDAMRHDGYLPPGPLPIRAIIYTHNHIDHIGGVWSYLKAAEPRMPCPTETHSGGDAPFDADASDCIALIGQEQIVSGVNNTATVIGTMINNRSAYMYGNYLPPDWVINDGIGPRVNRGTAAWRMPSRTFTNSMHLTAAGVKMNLIYVPSETDDELAVFIPDSENGGSGNAGLLQSAEVLQGPSFPNLYSLRGTSYRNPATWFRSVDTLRKYDSWCMVPSHGTPLCGAENVQTLLQNFRDAVQFTHDQAVRWMNKGYTMQQLPELIKMPDYLIDDLSTIQTAKTDTDPKDYLRAFYGSVPQAVRELYFGYLGWFQADPVGLAPIPARDEATRMVALMGGHDKVLSEAQSVFDKGDFQWSAELTSILVRRDPSDIQARELKAQAFEKLAAPVTNPNWRNWYITAARELRGLTPHSAIAGGLTSPGIVDALPYGLWVNQWTLRLKAEQTIADKIDTTLGLWFSDTSEGYVLHIRRGICELDQQVDEATVRKCANAIAMAKAEESALVYADNPGAKIGYIPTLAGLIDSGKVPVLNGNKAGVLSFFGRFDPAPETVPSLAGR
jgi:alkyl sulfatase BDS1-like metallo-beta-lactamase superfamily hydrolase